MTFSTLLQDMSDSISILSAPPSYDIAVQEAVEPEEHESRTSAVPETSLVVLAPSATLSTETLVDPRPTISSSHILNAEVRGPFTFSSFDSNTMLLLPHPLSPNSRPLYRISVSSDCFRPHIYTTTICRGGSDQGHIVAEIKQPLCEHDKQRGTVQVGQKIVYISNILFRKGDSEAIQQRYDWNSLFHEGKSLRWETKHHGGKVISVQCTQYGVRNAPTFASFRPNKRSGQQTLEIFPEGLPFMDDIVVSCLAIESRRTTRYDK